MNKRIIITGPSASGKDYLKNNFKKRNFTYDVSYTSRKIREGEVDGEDYNFITKEDFEKKIEEGFFYEYAKYDNGYYGTGLKEWEERNIFIMETNGIKDIKPEDRKDCFIIYVNPPLLIRQARMQGERKWNLEQITARIKQDEERFKDFTDYDMIITQEEF